MGYICDIYDGEAYQSHMVADGFLVNPLNISLTMNTDGVRVFKSSNISFWPVYFTINELAPQLRYMHVQNLYIPPQGSI